jgi:hypothetical protein
MAPQLDPELVSVAMRALEASGRLRRANECVVEFQGKCAIAHCSQPLPTRTGANASHRVAPPSVTMEFGQEGDEGLQTT